MPTAGRASRGRCARRRAGSAAEHCRNAARQRDFDLLRADEMNMRINRARRHDAIFARNNFGRSAHDHVSSHAVLQVGVARFADADDYAIAQPDVGFDDAQ